MNFSGKIKVIHGRAAQKNIAGISTFALLFHYFIT